MVAKKTKAQLLKALKKGQERQKGKEVDYGRMDMPFVSNAVARLTRGEIKAYASGPNKGKYFLGLGGVAVSPKVNSEGQKVKGLTVNKQFDLFEVKRKDRDGKDITVSEEEMQDLATNEVRKIDVEAYDAYEGDVEEFLKELIEGEETYFGFEVRKYMGIKYENGKPVRVDGQPVKEEKKWTEFLGSAGIPENFDPDSDSESDIEDETEDSEEEETEEETEEEPEVDQTVDDGDDEESLDIEALGIAADEGDEDAIDKLTQLCEENDVDLESMEEDPWTEVASAIIAEIGEDAEDNEENDEADSSQPVVDDIYKYKNKAGKVGRYKVVEVDLEAETVKLKSLTGPGRTSCKWSSLLEDD